MKTVYCSYCFKFLSLLIFSMTSNGICVSSTTTLQVSSLLPSFPSPPQNEMVALQSIYDSTNGPYWILTEDDGGIAWNFNVTDPNPCANNPLWYGVTCSSDTNESHVVVLNLISSNLSGTIPENIAELTELTYLSLDRNSLHSTIPPAIGNLSKLTNLYLLGNELTGTLPPELGNLTSIVFFSLAENRLSGTIPNSFGNFVNCTGFQLYSNLLTGTLPPALGSMSSVLLIYLYSNLLTGTLPSELGQLTRIRTFYMYDNLITGNIPRSFVNWVSCLNFELSFNLLTGTIPVLFKEMKHLQVLFLNNNFFHGSINSLSNLTQLSGLAVSVNLMLSGTLPVEIGYFKHLFQLYLWGNIFTGTVPESFGNLTLCKNLELNSNLLTGTIPESFGNLTALAFLMLEDNLLTGSLPSSFTNMSALTACYLNNNLLTGALPVNLGNLTHLSIFYSFGNAFTGSIPDSIGELLSLSNLQICYNYHSGTLPTSLCNCKDLITIELEGNYFTGTVPSCFGSLIVNLTDVQFQSNFLSGSLPSSLGAITTLNTFYIQNNLFEGTLNNIFNVTTQTVLSYLDFSTNQFSGSFPTMVLFHLKSLATLSAVNNCLSGTLSSGMCAATSLTALVLDGIGTATQCQRRLFPFIKSSTAYLANRHLSGHLPTCLFDLPVIQTLHLSGNAITGSIPSHVIISESLQYLSLSHNRLVGTVPSSVQHHPWISLDLSFNKLNGVLNSNFTELMGNTSSTSLSLEVNRLSGEIPNTVRNCQNVNILDGNMFTCGIFNRNALPPNDESVDNYQCGSNSVNLSLYIFSGFFVAVMILIIVLSRLNFIQQYMHILSNYFESLKNTEKSNIRQFHIDCQNHNKFTSVITCTVLLVFVPLYITLHVYFGTSTNTYAWVVSVAFISGVIPGALLLVIFIVVVCLILVKHQNETNKDTKCVIPSQNDQNQSHLSFHAVLITICLLVINSLIVISVNAFYVWFSLTSTNQTAIAVMSILLALFKSTWNEFAVPFLFEFLDIQQKVDKQHHLVLRICLILFNNIICPCAATAAISPNCFYYALSNSDTVSATSLYSVCTTNSLEGSCTATNTAAQLTTQYAPPYIYSYQCSSTFVTYYSSVFVYMYLMNGALQPLVVFALYWLFGGRYFIPRLFVKSTTAANKALHSAKPLFKTDSFVVAIVTAFSIMFTFGVAFPPLACVIGIAVCLNVFVIQMAIGRLITSSSDNDCDNDAQTTQYKERLNTECDGVFNTIKSLLWIVVPFMSVFYGMFLTDIVGDQVGFEHALWAPLTMILLPLFVYLCILLRNNGFYKPQTTTACVEIRASVVELLPRTSSSQSTTNAGIVGNPMIVQHKA